MKLKKVRKKTEFSEKIELLINFMLKARLGKARQGGAWQGKARFIK